MPLTFPITTSGAIVVLPGLEISTTDPSAFDDTVLTIVDDANNKIKTFAEIRGCSFSSLTDHQSALFGLIAQLKAFVSIVENRGFASDYKSYVELLNFVTEWSEWLEFGLRVGHFDQSWLNETQIPLVQLGTEIECVQKVASFKVSSNSKPSETTVQYFAQGVSAIIYSVASRQGCFPIPSNLNDIPTKVKNFYLKLLQGFVGSLVAAIRGSTYTDNSDSHYKYAKRLFVEAQKEFRKFQSGVYTSLTE